MGSRDPSDGPWSVGGRKWTSSRLSSAIQFERDPAVSRLRNEMEERVEGQGVELSHVVEGLTDRNRNQTVQIPTPFRCYVDDTEREIRFAFL